MHQARRLTMVQKYCFDICDENFITRTFEPGNIRVEERTDFRGLVPVSDAVRKSQVDARELT